MNNIDYTKLLDNINTMINLLEYDSMRSAGKAKLNSQHLHSLYFLQERYEANVAKASKATKATSKKSAEPVA